MEQNPALWSMGIGVERPAVSVTKKLASRRSPLPIRMSPIAILAKAGPFARGSPGHRPGFTGPPAKRSSTNSIASATSPR
jgi:hypothetical protein